MIFIFWKEILKTGMGVKVTCYFTSMWGRLRCYVSPKL